MVASTAHSQAHHISCDNSWHRLVAVTDDVGARLRCLSNVQLEPL